LCKMLLWLMSSNVRVSCASAKPGVQISGVSTNVGALLQTSCHCFNVYTSSCVSLGRI